MNNIGQSSLGAHLAAIAIQNANHRMLFMPFDDGVANSSATAVADATGHVSSATVAGTTAGLWAVPTDGITLTTDNYIWLNSSNAALDMDFINGIYACDGGYDKIIYFGCDISIDAAPASDTANYLLSMGRRDDVNPNDFGQLCMRINANRSLSWHLRTRQAVQTNEYSGMATGLTDGAAPVSVFSFIIPGTSSNVSFYLSGALNNTGSLANINTMGPLAESAHGIALFGTTTHNSPFTPANMVGSGTVAPTVRNLVIGSCSNNAANLARLPKLAAHLNATKRLPHWIQDID